MDIGTGIALGIAILALLGLIGGYLKFVLGIEHRITKLETIFEFIPFSKVFGLLEIMLSKIPSAKSHNPYDRRGELLAKLERQELNYNEAIELRDSVTNDVERSTQDEIMKALILIGLGILIGYVLSRR